MCIKHTQQWFYEYGYAHLELWVYFMMCRVNHYIKKSTCKYTMWIYEIFQKWYYDIWHIYIVHLKNTYEIFHNFLNHLRNCLWAMASKDSFFLGRRDKCVCLWEQYNIAPLGQRSIITLAAGLWVGWCFANSSPWCDIQH